MENSMDLVIYLVAMVAVDEGKWSTTNVTGTAIVQ